METTDVESAPPPPKKNKKKTKKPTLKTVFRRDENFRDQWKLFIALAYVPADDVRDVFFQLYNMDDLHPQLKKYLDKYFKTTYICNAKNRGNGRYPVESWNIHEM